jgi:hypothetical protein
VFASGCVGEVGSSMIQVALQQAFDDVIKHLGVEVEYKPKGYDESKIIRMCCKHPENMYEVGNSQIIGQVAEFAVRKSDAQPMVGDVIFVGSKRYKIYEEPLLDASNLIWKFNAILEGIRNHE